MPEFLTASEVAKMLKVSPSRLADLVRMNVIPKPLVLGPKTRRWRASDFEATQKVKPRNNPWDDYLAKK